MTTHLGILSTHPIQYHAPWFRHLAQIFDIEVLYVHRPDARAQAEAGFGVEFEWDVSLLDGYRHRWLRNVAAKPGVGSFAGCNTPELYDLIPKAGYDAFLVFGWHYRSALQAIRACWKHRVPVLSRGDSHLLTERPVVTSALKYLPYRYFLPRLDGHLYVGSRNRDYLEHYGVPARRLFFAPHFVDQDFFRTRAAEAEASGAPARFRQQLGIPPHAFVILFVGKFIEIKRPLDFVEAAIRSVDAADGPPVHAVLVGDGPMRPALEEAARRAPGSIGFAGFRNQSELATIYRSANVLVLPAATETWGLVVNEAMACGLPAIASDIVGCAPDMIDEGSTGFTYAVGNIDALVARIGDLQHLCASDERSVRVAIEEKSERYSLERATKGLGEALEAVAAGAGQAR